jgi:hypothetical protein
VLSQLAALVRGRTALLVGGLLSLYIAGFLAFPPQTPTVVDATSYLWHAEIILKGGGEDLQLKLHPLSGQLVEARVSGYPVGTALFLAAGLWLGGEAGAFAVPLVCLVVGTLLTARWLIREGRSPLFALIIPGFPAALVLGRVTMSDVPSLAVVSLGLLLFWCGIDARRRLLWLAAGFVAGASIVFRESNALLFAGFFAGAALRRDRDWWALLVGGLAGVALRLASGAYFYGDPFFYKGSSAVFGRDGLLEALPLQLLGLLVLVPGGLLGALAYRGRRRAELVATLLGFCGFYLVYGYAAGGLGVGSRLVLGLRFLIPLLPLLAFGMAESFPRLWRQLAEARTARQRKVLDGLRLVAVGGWVAGVAAASLLVHWVHHRHEAPVLEIRSAIESHTDAQSIIVSELSAVSRYLPLSEFQHLPLDRREVDRNAIRTLARRHGGFSIVLLDRGESAGWRRLAEENARFVAGIQPPPRLELDRTLDGSNRLRIWRVGPPAQPVATSPRPATPAGPWRTSAAPPPAPATPIFAASDVVVGR